MLFTVRAATKRTHPISVRRAPAFVTCVVIRDVGHDRRYARRVGEGFGRVDRIAKEMAGRARPVRRSTPVRWAILGALALAGTAGALFFVGGSGPRKMPKPAPPPDPTRQASAAEPAAAPPALPALPPAGRDRALRAAQIAVVLDGIDANLHALRIEWPGQKDSIVDWDWPDWMPLARMNEQLAALDAQLGAATDPLSNATRAWLAMARSDGARLHELVGMWNKPDASVDAITAELRPMFDRMVAASQAVHAAVAADLVAPERGTLAALGNACRVAPLFARMSLVGPAAPRPAVERNGAPATPADDHALQADVTFDELHAHSLACLDEVRAFLAARPVGRLDYHAVYQLGLASQTATNLLVEIGRRQDARKDRPYVSATGTLAHESTYMSAQRREHDASLRPVPAEASPP